ncbi:hypothetical protein [Cellulosimicrobium marinum]|uniref:hypothetical protein n=1 Tax=Cellulosimicrobium marinum TaxID=1638992 RepID=UPI001E359EEE|nr:hypothetical protein [Cellulosimicrobium marinum]MCB7136039.1 hypothetical protein [Cellulosimicrobium marinum]
MPPGPRPAHRPSMVWARVHGGVRGRERLTPVLDFLSVLLILLACTGGAVWAGVWGLRADEGVVALLAGVTALAFGSGAVVYVRAPLRRAVVLRPHEIELPVDGPEVRRVVVRWEDVAHVEVAPGERRPVLRVALHDGARPRHADGDDDLLQTRLPAAPPEPDAVVVADPGAVALVLQHLLDHPEDRARLAGRGGLGVVLAFSRPEYGTTEP